LLICIHSASRFTSRRKRAGWRAVRGHVGFSCHVFTSAVENSGPAPELHFDRRETRASDHKRYNCSFHLKGIVTEPERRKCYFVRRDRFVTVEDKGTQPGYEYRVFFSMRRKDASAVELVVQSAYIGRKDVGRPRGQSKHRIRFRMIVGKVISKQELAEAR
jgi:hypothetical protein